MPLRSRQKARLGEGWAIICRSEHRPQPPQILAISSKSGRRAVNQKAKRIPKWEVSASPNRIRTHNLLVDKRDRKWAFWGRLEKKSHRSALTSRLSKTVHVETKFLRLCRAVEIGDDLDGWGVCWLGGWDKCPCAVGRDGKAYFSEIG